MVRTLHYSHGLTYPGADRSTSIMMPSVAARHSSGASGLAALELLQSLADELSKGTVDLPCFPNVVLRIRDALSDPDTSIDVVGRMVAAEPRLSARLLQMANAAAINPSGRRIVDLKAAITRLGRQMVQGAAMSYAVQQLKEAPMFASLVQPLTELWRRSIAAASICQVIARRTSVPPDAAFLTGLLHGIGRLYIMVATVRRPLDPESAGALEELIGDWHPTIGQMVLVNWEMDGVIAQAVNDQRQMVRPKHDNPDLCDILVVAVGLSEILLDGAKNGAELEQSPAFRSLGLKGEDCGLILTHASYQLDSLMEVLAC